MNPDKEHHEDLEKGKKKIITSFYISRNLRDRITALAFNQKINPLGLGRTFNRIAAYCLDVGVQHIEELYRDNLVDPNSLKQYLEKERAARQARKEKWWANKEKRDKLKNQ
jgi:hypothetical protein